MEQTNILVLDIASYKRDFRRLRKLHGAVEEVVTETPDEDDEDMLWKLKAAKPKHRWRYGAMLAAKARGDKRPTEFASLARSYGFPILDTDFWDDVFWMQRSGILELKRTCIKCEVHKPFANFEREKRFPSGVSFYCGACREKYIRRPERWRWAA